MVASLRCNDMFHAIFIVAWATNKNRGINKLILFNHLAFCNAPQSIWANILDFEFDFVAICDAILSAHCGGASGVWTHLFVLLLGQVGALIDPTLYATWRQTAQKVKVPFPVGVTRVFLCFVCCHSM